MATALIRRYTGLLGLDELILQNIEVARPLTLETPFTSGHLIFSMFHDDCVVVGCEKMLNPSSLFCHSHCFAHCKLERSDGKYREPHIALASGKKGNLFRLASYYTEVQYCGMLSNWFPSIRI